MKDMFSDHAQNYARYRPHYPEKLFEFVLSHVPVRNLAWDCGTGNGQTASVLAAFFKKVHATDISLKQIEHAIQLQNIHYCTEDSARTSLEAGSVNLVTVSQAIHWFHLPGFYAEVKRVSAPGAVIAVWGYSLLRSDACTDELISQLYHDVLKGYWEPERKLLDDHYRFLSFPFREIEVPSLSIKLNWERDTLEGYLNTWSAVQKYISLKGTNPVNALMVKLDKCWKRNEKRQIEFPLHIKMGHVH